MFAIKINNWGDSTAKWCFAHQTSTIRHQTHFFCQWCFPQQKTKAVLLHCTYFERETFHWTLWCCNLYLWVIMVSDVLLYVREARQWQKQGCSGEPFPRSINQVAVCSVSVVHQTTIWTKKDLESWFSVEGLDWCFCHVTKKQKVSIFPLLLLIQNFF